jgi:hypothetical protein
MDILLNGIFFKCYLCKVLTKIVHRESISPEHENMNRLIYNNNPNISGGNNNFDSEIKNLFHPTLINENNTPMKNLFTGYFNFNNSNNTSLNNNANNNFNMTQPFINPNIMSKI